MKKPTDYGQAQINKIMSVKDDIIFKTITQTPASSTEIDNEGSEMQIEEDSIDNAGGVLPVCLLKIVDEEVGRKAFEGGDKISEEEVDVLLRLRDEEFTEVMNAFANCFTDDALRALKANHKSQQEGVIVATYTENAGVFWLFYYESLVQDIEGLDQNQTIPGYWLDKKRGAWYRLMTTATSIKFRNIVKDSSKHLISWKHKIEKNAKQMKVDN